ncbi:hypothetical protein L211DRAFT_850773 [Terfezia boudieri ATCC MYA-4762]|uniref:Uncharacterized protein n=1 Tax=Terfezia boudieri ATCC MYA-4762 TaxID=1051890 RepID=A0A3N4LH51_9PEZI|nr:hypothetical protein L211DRAFT_850773 [Terfezia boudieri ATCC MYA-4762]
MSNTIIATSTMNDNLRLQLVHCLKKWGVLSFDSYYMKYYIVFKKEESGEGVAIVEYEVGLSTGKITSLIKSIVEECGRKGIQDIKDLETALQMSPDAVKAMVINQVEKAFPCR